MNNRERTFIAIHIRNQYFIRTLYITARCSANKQNITPVLKSELRATKNSAGSLPDILYNMFKFASYRLLDHLSEGRTEA